MRIFENCRLSVGGFASNDFCKRFLKRLLYRISIYVCLNLFSSLTPSIYQSITSSLLLCLGVCAHGIDHFRTSARQFHGIDHFRTSARQFHETHRGLGPAGMSCFSTRTWMCHRHQRKSNIHAITAEAFCVSTRHQYTSCDLQHITTRTVSCNRKDSSADTATVKASCFSMCTVKHGTKHSKAGTATAKAS